ncbi:MAG: hypothetical protein WBP22_00880 [Candidatus Saccharimonas sp.]
MTLLIMGFGSLQFALGFSFVMTSHRVTERRKWVYRLVQVAIACFLVGVLLEGDIAGALIMIAAMASARYVYRRKLKSAESARRSRRGFTATSATAGFPVRTTLTPARRERVHDDIGSVPLSYEEELLLAGIRQGLRESSDS